jgi:hypothetical protein
MPGGDADGGLGRLAGLHALGGWLDAVIDGVAQEVQQGLLEHFQQCLVDLDLLALDFEADLAAQGAGELAQGHGEVIEQRGQRDHAQLARRAVEIPDEAFEIMGLVAQTRFHVGKPGHDARPNLGGLLAAAAGRPPAAWPAPLRAGAGWSG